MPLHPAVGPGVTNALIESGRFLQVTEEDSQALHADFLAWGEHLGGKQIAKFLHGGHLQRRRGIGIPFEALQHCHQHARRAVVQTHDDTARAIRQVCGCPAIVLIDQVQGGRRYGGRHEPCCLIGA